MTWPVRQHNPMELATKYSQYSRYPTVGPVFIYVCLFLLW